MSSSRPIIRWLDATVVAVALAVVVGGITRLTHSGLSITTWNPVSGALPPLTDVDWATAFAGYLQIPEAQTVHKGITLGGFKALYWWEWTHRLIARGVGLVIALPYFWFLVRGRLPARHRVTLGALPLLVAAQGALGWFMVSSGLSERTDVSQYRLVAHLGLALVILVSALWIAASLRAERDGVSAAAASGWSRLTMGFAAWTFGVVLTGGFVAGLDGGFMYNTFPLMGGQVVPPGYWLQPGFLANAFENPAAAQFHHRVVAVLTVLFAYALWVAARRRPLAPSIVRAQGWVAVIATLQVALGIVTLLLGTPVVAAVLHQAVAVVLLGAVVLAAHAARLARA